MTLAKTARPATRGAVPRPRLFRLLDRARSRPVTWVWGPPGAGKTTVVAAYVAARRSRTLWYQLDAGDGDVAAFFYYLCQAAPGKSPALPPVRPESHAAPAALARPFFRDLYARLRPPFVLVLDNYREVPAGSELHALMPEAVAELPPGGRVIVISRAEAPGAFARLRAAHAVAEIGWPELRLTGEEARRLVQRVAPRFPRALVGAVHERTGGWAAGMVLMLQDRRGVAAERRRTPDGIFDYFAGEVLDRAEPDTRTILLETAFLRRVTGAMAEPLTGRPAAARVLAHLARQNYFTVQHPGPPVVYEYHPLFRAFLLRRAHADVPRERRADLLRRGAALLLEAGQVEDAAGLLREAGEWEALARLVAAHAGTLAADGRGQTVEGWIAAVPAEVIEGAPWLLFWRAACRLASAPAASRADFERALALFRERREASGVFLAWAHAVETFALERHDVRPLDRWIGLFDELLNEFPVAPSAAVETKVASCMLLALVCRQPQRRDIKVWAERALALAESGSDLDLRMQSTSAALAYQLWTGDLEDAVTLAEHLRVLQRVPEAPPLRRIIAALVRGRLEWLTASFAAARATLEEALGLAQATGIHVFDHTLMCDLAAAALSEGDRPAARAWLEAAGGTAGAVARLDRACHHLLVGWEALRAGDVTAALGEHDAVLAATWESGMPASQCLAHFFSAQVLEAQKMPGAEVHLAQGLDIARQMDSRLLQFMGLLIEAHVAARRGDEARAVQLLAQAMPIGRRHGYRNTWLWDPEMMAELAVRALEADVEVDYVRQLVTGRRLVPRTPPLKVEQWPWPVKVLTLGRFEIVTRGTPVHFTGKTQKKPLALLQALVALGGQNVREERLTEVLWPDAEGDAAHQALAVTLHRLRRLLGHDRAVARHEGKISLVPEHCWVDLWAVERMISRAEAAIARSPVRDHEWVASLRWTNRALALYQGDFLSADPGLPWAEGVAERLKERLLRQLRRVGHLWEHMGDWEEAVECYEKAVRLSDTAEEFYRRLMMGYKHLDRRGDAILAYQRCRKALASVLGIPPSPETEALLQSVHDL